jgi:hypothetical protein
MDTSKVIELGNVSEETQGVGFDAEHVGSPVKGPNA